MSGPEPVGQPLPGQVANRLPKWSVDAALRDDVVPALRKARRLLTQGGATIAAARLQHVIDLLDPRMSERLRAREFRTGSMDGSGRWAPRGT